jgi:hypothetical protein
MKSTIDPVPLIIAGIETVRCECGYETTVIMPEEYRMLAVKLLEHIQQHGIAIPQFTMEIH